MVIVGSSVCGIAENSMAFGDEAGDEIEIDFRVQSPKHLTRMHQPEMYALCIDAGQFMVSFVTPIPSEIIYAVLRAQCTHSIFCTFFLFSYRVDSQNGKHIASILYNNKAW